MAKQDWRKWGRSLLTVLLLGSGLILRSPSPVHGQVVPDGTLGEERSQVNAESDGIGALLGIPQLEIEGGAVRGSNLFHSFQSFNIKTGQSVYFLDPVGVSSIFSRVTGSDPSKILGRLGVLGSADLYFMNPNGIVFGPNSSLDVQGSFIGTTANSIAFGEKGVFSATSPDLPLQVLTVNPSAFLFSQSEPSGIVNNATDSPSFLSGRSNNATDSPSFLSGRSGLRISDGQSLLLIGGDINLGQSSSIQATGGRIELGGLSEPGEIAIDEKGSFLALTFPEDLMLSNVSLLDRAIVTSTSESQQGAIAVHADSFTAVGGGRLGTFTAGLTVGGDVEIKANTVRLEGVSIINSAPSIFTIGEPQTSLSGSGLFTQSIDDSTGTAGNISVNAETVLVKDGAEISQQRWVQATRDTSPLMLIRLRSLVLALFRKLPVASADRLARIL